MMNGVSKIMNVLVACEESQRVAVEFRKRGHNAFSCDILEPSGEHPEWHIKDDVVPLLNGDCVFETMEGIEHEIVGKWDMIIAFPPCTYLTVTGNRWFNVDRYGDKAIKRLANRVNAVQFFLSFANADCRKIAIENPIGHMSTAWRKPDQIIQPYYFGDAARKATCLWLKGLPTLNSTRIVEPEIIEYKNGRGTDNPWHMNTMRLPPEQRAKARSKTFPGIAKAMAEQWGD
jgi:hypothetical protein